MGPTFFKCFLFYLVKLVNIVFFCFCFIATGVFYILVNKDYEFKSTKREFGEIVVDVMSLMTLIVAPRVSFWGVLTDF